MAKPIALTLCSKCYLQARATCDTRALDRLYGHGKHSKSKPYRVCAQHARAIEDSYLSAGDGETPITWDQ